MRFTHQLELAAPAAAVWACLRQVEPVARCIPGVTETAAVEGDQRYRAVVSDRVGLFQVQFPLDLEVTRSGAARLEVAASGRDALTGSHVVLHLAAEVAPVAAAASRLDLAVDLQVTGRLATLGHSMMVRVFDQKMKAFAAALQRELGGSGDVASV